METLAAGVEGLEVIASRAPTLYAVILVIMVMSAFQIRMHKLNVHAQAKRDKMFAEALQETGKACHIQSRDLDDKYERNSDKMVLALKEAAATTATALNSNTEMNREIKTILLARNGKS